MQNLLAHNYKSQNGFSLIEALVAFAVLSFGMMGVVTLLATSKTSQFETVQRTRAITLANTLVERVRINPSAATAYHTGLSTPRGVVTTLPAEPSPDCTTGACSAAQLATHDLWRWEQDLRGAAAVDGDGRNTGGLVQPRGCVVFTADAPLLRPNSGTLQVIVTWRGLVESADAAVAAAATCGAGGAGTDDYRRQVVVNTRIIDETDLANEILPPPPP